LVAKEAIGDILDEDVNAHVVECIRLENCDSVERGRVAAATITEMYEKFVKPNWRGREIGDVIRRDAGLRILLIGLRMSFDRRILVMAVRLNKWALFSLASKAIRTLMCRWTIRCLD
jgi:hypothetical protein